MADTRQLFQRIASAAARIDPGLSDHDIDRLVEGARGRKRRRVVRRVGLGATLVGAGIAVVLLATTPGPTRAPIGARPQAKPVSASLNLRDGSIATPLDASSVLAVREDSPRRVALALDRGRARFEVVPRPERPFVVHMGEVTVTVVGTVFTVERVADRIGVSVERGSVRVDWQVGEQVLHTGDGGWFPPVQIRTPPDQLRESHALRPARTRQPRMAANIDSPAEIPAAPAPSAEDLLAAADTARSAGRSAESARLLGRLLREHRDDARAPLAAFTLGRVLLMELARPREAALAFAEVRTLAPTGPFAEDALAREAEAWSKAGDSGKAGARAREYLRLYPHGRRAGGLRGLAGIE
jgi:transmembrane sensor